MYKLRIKYAKKDSLRFLSHLEVIRTLERASRRAKLPLAFTQGFSPHPRISFGPPLSVGISSQTEYADLILTTEFSLGEALRSLNQSLPAGFEVLAAKYLTASSPSLTEIINLAIYEVAVRGTFSPTKFGRWLKSFLSQDEFLVERQLKDKVTSFNLFDRLISLEGERLTAESLFFKIVLQVGTRGTLRPDEAIKAFSEFCGVEMEIVNIERVGLFINRDGTLIDPLEDR